jgi:RNA polymerase sigma factor (sigma-70 family)
MTVVRPAIGVEADEQRLREERLRTVAARLADDPTAFEELYALLAPGTLRLLRRLVPPADAEDVLQNTFADVWRDRAGYDPQRPVRGWVTGIARHRCADLLRSRVPRPVAGLDDADTFELFATALNGPTAGTGAGEDVAERVVRNRLVLGALRSVSVEQREVLALAYFRDLTQPEIAEWLDIPLGTVKARCARGLRALANALRTSPTTSSAGASTP